MFGYGSLIWRPGFDFVERVPARIIGLHRSLCVYSFEHRGTPERPGPGARPRSRRRLPRHRLSGRGEAARRDARPICATASRPRRCIGSWCAAIWLDGKPERRVDALCYVVDRGHPQYAGRLTLERQLHIVRQGHGRSGNNRDYVIETVNALEALDIVDHDLQVLAERLKGSQDAACRLGPSLFRRRLSSAWPSATSRAVAVSISFCSRSKNACLVEPRRDRIGRNSTTIVPGSRRNERRGQNRPELSATGTQGTPISA